MSTTWEAHITSTLYLIYYLPIVTIALEEVTYMLNNEKQHL